MFFIIERTKYLVNQKATQKGEQIKEI